jgi:hypothetical protein
VALYVVHAGARILPLLPAPELDAYTAACGNFSARLHLESLYDEWLAPRPGALHLMLVNSEHLFVRDASLHARIDVFLCKTRFCTALMQRHIEERGIQADVWYVGHTSSDVLVPAVESNDAGGSSRSSSSRARGASSRGRAVPASVHTMHTMHTEKMHKEQRLVQRQQQQHPQSKEQQRNQQEDVSHEHRHHHRRQAPVLAHDSATPVGVSPAPAVLHQHHLLVPRGNYSRALHVKGKSGLKHTRQVLECWARHPDLPHLTVIGRELLDGIGDATRAALVAAENVVLLPTPQDIADARRKAAEAELRDEAVRTAAAAAAAADAADAADAAATVTGARHKVKPSAATTAARMALHAVLTHGASASASAQAGVIGDGTLVDYAAIRELQAASGLHLCLSEREGFGHSINEARAAGTSCAHGNATLLMLWSTSHATLRWQCCSTGSASRRNYIHMPHA